MKSSLNQLLQKLIIEEKLKNSTSMLVYNAVYYCCMTLSFKQQKEFKKKLIMFV